jgi:hypothetical protein
VERTDDPEGGVFSRRLVEQVATDRPSDIFLFSHGWKGDVPAAVDQYNRWIGALWRLDADRNRLPGLRPLFIGLHWPSQPWGEEALAASFGAGDVLTTTLVDTAVRHFGGGEAVRAPLEVIVNAYLADPAAREIPDEVRQAYATLAGAIGFGAGASADGPPDQEGAALDPQAAVRAEQLANIAGSFGAFGALKDGILAGLRQLSFWLMKHRARTVGEQGMHTFVGQLQRAGDARIHLMGHSFGSIVVSSILGGPGGRAPLARPVHSVVLVQAALSLWSYARAIPEVGKPGYFAGVLDAGAVSGPIVTTQSSHDTAVGVAYPAAVWLVNEVAFVTDLPKFGGIGTWGIQGVPETTAMSMLDCTGDYGFEAGGIYNVDGSRYIPGHCGIDGPEVAHLQWQAATMIEPRRHPDGRHFSGDRNAVRPPWRRR